MNISSCLTGSGSSSSNAKGSENSHGMLLLVLTHAHAHLRTSARLDQRAKELAQEKEELLRSSKSQAATTESVKLQIETLLKVVFASLSRPKHLFLNDMIIHFRLRQKSARRSRSSSRLLRTHPEKRPFPVSTATLRASSISFRVSLHLHRPPRRFRPTYEQ